MSLYLNVLFASLGFNAEHLITRLDELEQVHLCWDRSLLGLAEVELRVCERFEGYVWLDGLTYLLGIGPW
jgi:hypothetical protein